MAHSRGEHQLRFLVATITNEAARGNAIVIVMRRFERFTARRKQTLLCVGHGHACVILLCAKKRRGALSVGE